MTTRPSDSHAGCSGRCASCTARLWADGLVSCLSEHSIICEHALPFGDGHFCLHPRNLEIAGGGDGHGAG